MIFSDLATEVTQCPFYGLQLVVGGLEPWQTHQLQRPRTWTALLTARSAKETATVFRSTVWFNFHMMIF